MKLKRRSDQERVRQLLARQKVLEEERARVNRKLSQIWQTFNLPPSPKTYGDFLYGLIVREVYSAGLREKGDDRGAEDLREYMPGYNFTNPSLSGYTQDWRVDNFARVAVGHKLSSVLMLTAIPEDIEVRSPWATWVLEIPDGMYPFNFSPEALEEAVEQGKPSLDLSKTPATADTRPSHIRALFCRGPEPVQALLDLGGKYFAFKMSEYPQLIHNFVRGVCLSIDDRKHVQERSWARSETQRRSGEPGYGRSYTLAHPVTIDFRGEVRQLLDNPRKHAHVSQWLVRGHWRNQACGPGMRDRKRTRIDPYWKGPEDARVLLRGYKIKE